MRLRKGKAVEWIIAKRYKGGLLDFWDQPSTEREARKCMRETYNTVNFVLLKVTYELAAKGKP